MNLAVEHLAEQERQNLLRGAIALHPPAWVSALDRSGHCCLAPFAFVTAVSLDPMTLLFCVSNAEEQVDRGIIDKESVDQETVDQEKRGNLVLQAIVGSGEFVVNLLTAEMIAAVNLPTLSSLPGAAAVDWGALTVPSQTIRPPRVAGASTAFECRLHQVMKVGYGAGGSSVIFGDVKSVYMHEQPKAVAP